MPRLLTALVLFAFTLNAFSGDEGFPRVAGAYLVKRDGRVLWAAAADERMEPASLTKMMTALVLIEGGRLDETVTVGRAASRERGSRLGLKAGDQVWWCTRPTTPAARSPTTSARP
jgi:D-alanyl-D-alanine carboxypeptidase